MSIYPIHILPHLLRFLPRQRPPKFTTDGTTEEINLFQNGVRQRVESLAMEKTKG